MRLAKEFEGFIRNHFEAEPDRPGPGIISDVEGAIGETLDLLQRELDGGGLEGCEDKEKIEDWLFREAFDSVEHEQALANEKAREDAEEKDGWLRDSKD
jgi:hypothetical protein